MTPARGSWMRPTPGPGELLREGLGRGEDRKRGRGWRRSAILCKPALQSLALSQKLSHSPVRCSCIPSSSALLPVLPDRHGSLGPVQGKAFQPFSPLSSPLVQESALSPSNSGKAAGELVIMALEGAVIHLQGHVPSHGTTLMSQQSGRAQRSQPSAITKCSCPGFN